MLRIAEEALTFDDVLLLPAHSVVLPKTVALNYPVDAFDRAQYSAYIICDGHGYRVPSRDCYGARGWLGCAAQEHEC